MSFLLDRDDGFLEAVPADVGLEDAAEEAIASDFDLRVNHGFLGLSLSG